MVHECYRKCWEQLTIWVVIMKLFSYILLVFLGESMAPWCITVCKTVEAPRNFCMCLSFVLLLSCIPRQVLSFTVRTCYICHPTTLIGIIIYYTCVYRTCLATCMYQYRYMHIHVLTMQHTPPLFNCLPHLHLLFPPCTPSPLPSHPSVPYTWSSWTEPYSSMITTVPAQHMSANIFQHMIGLS